MKQYKRSLILIVILAIISGYLYFTKTESSIDANYSEFAIKDTASINRVDIFYDTLSVTLEKKVSGWKLESGNFARKQAINIMLQTLEGLKMLTPVQKSEQDTINKLLEKYGLEIQIYQFGDLKKSYLIGRKAPQLDGYYMKEKSSRSAYIVENMGIGGPLHRVFIPKEGYWRDPTVFRYSINDIKSITVNYPKEKEKSFKIVKNGNQLNLFQLENNSAIENASIEAMQYYLSYFQNIMFEKVDNSLTANQIDSIAASTPVVAISVEDINGSIRKIKTYLKPNYEAVKPDDFKFDIYRMYGIIDKRKEVVLVQYQVFDPLYKEINSFIKNQSE